MILDDVRHLVKIELKRISSRRTLLNSNMGSPFTFRNHTFIRLSLIIAVVVIATWNILSVQSRYFSKVAKFQASHNKKADLYSFQESVCLIAPYIDAVSYAGSLNNNPVFKLAIADNVMYIDFDINAKPGQYITARRTEKIDKPFIYEISFLNRSLDQFQFIQRGISGTHDFSDGFAKKLNSDKSTISSIHPCDSRQAFVSASVILATDKPYNNTDKYGWKAALYTNNVMCHDTVKASAFDLLLTSNLSDYKVLNVVGPSATDIIVEKSGQMTNDERGIQFAPNSGLLISFNDSTTHKFATHNHFIGDYDVDNLEPKRDLCPKINGTDKGLKGFKHSMKLGPLSTVTKIGDSLYFFYLNEDSEDMRLKMEWPHSDTTEYPDNIAQVVAGKEKEKVNIFASDKKMMAITTYNQSRNIMAIYHKAKSGLELFDCVYPCVESKQKTTAIKGIVPDDITDWAGCKKIATFFGLINTLHNYGEDIMNTYTKYSHTPKLELPPSAVHADGDDFWFFTRYNTLTIMRANAKDCSVLDFTTVNVFHETKVSALLGQKDPPFYVEDRYYGTDNKKWIPELDQVYYYNIKRDPPTVGPSTTLNPATSDTPSPTDISSTSNVPSTSEGESTAPTNGKDTSTSSLVVFSIIAVVLAVVVVISAAACCLMSGSRADAGTNKSYKSLRRPPPFREKSKKSHKSVRGSPKKQSLPARKSNLSGTKSVRSQKLSKSGKLSQTGSGHKSVRSGLHSPSLKSSAKVKSADRSPKNSSPKSSPIKSPKSKSIKMK
ncbi:hypothetical protein GZH46_00083, partial [Fragariocoptes setiger]